MPRSHSPTFFLNSKNSQTNYNTSKYNPRINKPHLTVYLLYSYSNPNAKQLLNTLSQSFDKGQKLAFFQAWQQLIPE